MDKHVVVGDAMAEHQPLVTAAGGEVITLTRPVTEADREWIEALRPHITVPPVRPIPCHPTRPLI